VRLVRDFGYARADDPALAVAAIAADPGARLIAGGTELVNLLKDGIDEAELLVDISRVPLTGIETGPDGLHLGALARMSDVAASPLVRRDYPGIAEALELSASAQLRNMATMGGNLMQRTRCPYFRADYHLPCNKRRPGTGCAALTGATRAAALFGASDMCVATHPSDVAVMLAALDATVQATGPQAARIISILDFHRLPGDAPERDTILGRDEMITGIDVPASSVTARSHYVKVRERASYEFALVSAAVAVDLDGIVIREARVALGGVAPRPWRLPAAERALVGVAARPGDLQAAIEPAFADARPLPGNVFKVKLAERTVLRALTEVIR
jgi:xanthine dehydrogenase YagS FAD-binding subunit